MEENTMTINSAARTISLTKKEMTAASRFGTVEYQNLQAARRDYPGFEVVTITRKVKTTRETYKGLTYDFMEKYIADHDDEDCSIMEEYKMYRGISKNPAMQIPYPYTYKEMKIWFLGKYEAVAQFYAGRN
jgi:hypothetical protein